MVSEFLGSRVRKGDTLVLEGCFLDGHFFAALSLWGPLVPLLLKCGTFPFLLVSAFELHDERSADSVFSSSFHFHFVALRLCVMMESIYLRFFFLFLPFHSRQSKARSYSYQCRGRDGGVCVGGDDSWDSIIVVFCRSGVTVSFSNCRWNNHSSGSRNHVDSFGSSFCIECSAEQSTWVSNSSTTNNDTNTTSIYNASSTSTTSSRSSSASSNTHTPTNTYTNTKPNQAQAHSRCLLGH